MVSHTDSIDADFHKRADKAIVLAWQNRHARIIGLLLFALYLPGCAQEEPLPVSARVEPAKFVSIKSEQPIAPLSTPDNLASNKIALGKRLFYDKRLSHDNSISCASCHDMNKGGADGRQTALGISEQVGHKNTPTVLNSSLSLAQFWDGRVRTLEEQVSGPVHNPIEMGSDWDEVIQKLNSDSQLVEAFQETYQSRITPESIVDAIAAFERSLITTGAPFDQYLLGDDYAVNAQVKQGYALFREVGCISCHQGRAIGGNMFQKFGVMVNATEIQPAGSSDRGRYAVTERSADLHRYKVPSLRNVELTAPYFHDGRTETLKEAIRQMARYQLGAELSDEEVQILEQFLKSLTGEIRSDWL